MTSSEGLKSHIQQKHYKRPRRTGIRSYGRKGQRSIQMETSGLMNETIDAASSCIEAVRDVVVFMEQGESNFVAFACVRLFSNHSFHGFHRFRNVQHLDDFQGLD